DILPNDLDAQMFGADIVELQVIRADAARARETLQPARNAVPPVARRPQHPGSGADPPVAQVPAADASRDVAHWDPQAFGGLDGIAADHLHIEEERAVVAALHTHH